MIYIRVCTSCESNIEFTASINNGYVIAVKGPQECPECKAYINHDSVCMDAQRQLENLTKPTDE